MKAQKVGVAGVVGEVRVVCVVGAVGVVCVVGVVGFDATTDVEMCALW